jgi:GTP-binding protein
MQSPSKIRNVAIIAHIDHGKTTIVDGLLRQSHVFRDNQKIPIRVMDSNDQEQERGITIYAKNTSVYHGEYKLNLIDTPGHSDFSAEVERILGMVNCVLLIVDAQEGPMPQTRFVLSKSLKMGIKPIVVLNKIDRPHANPERVLNDTFDLFVELGATDEQLDFKHCYASGLNGYAMMNLEDPRTDLNPLFDLIISAAPAPEGDISAPFLMQAASMAYDDYLGRQAIGRILRGTIKPGQQVMHIDHEGNKNRGTISRVQGHLGLEKVEMTEAGVGDIVTISGFPEVMIGDTLCDPAHIEILPNIEIEEPTVSIDITVNNGPLVGKSGKHVTMGKIRDRLIRENKANISYKFTFHEGNTTSITVAGRGELHLAVLLETMKREGYEFCVSKPQVILKQIDGEKCEPIEKVHIEVPEQYSGDVIQQLSSKKGELCHLMTDEHGICAMEFMIPARGLMGYRNNFLTSTRGLGILTARFEEYQPWKGEIIHRVAGSLIAMGPGKANGYACFNLEDRGELFVKPGDEVYEGMIVGEHARENDLPVNIVKEKQLTNVRASGKDEAIILKPCKTFNIEQAIGYIKEDELIEVTPDVLRIRKKYLTEAERMRVSRGK